MKYIISAILLVFSFQLSSQVDGIIIDSQSLDPISFAHIQISGSKKGFTANLEGYYSIKIRDTDTLVVSAIGYKTKLISKLDVKDTIVLNPTSYKLTEVIIQNQSKQLEIGRIKKQIFSNYNGAEIGYAYMIGRRLKYDSLYRMTPLIKKIEILTDSDIDSAQFNIRLYEADSYGFPDRELYNKSIFGFAQKGVNETSIDIEQLYLRFPENGLFIAIEWLDIKKNHFEWSYRDSETKKKKNMVSIEPSFALDNNKKGNKYYYNGKWRLDDYHDALPVQLRVTLRN